LQNGQSNTVATVRLIFFGGADWKFPVSDFSINLKLTFLPFFPAKMKALNPSKLNQQKLTSNTPIQSGSCDWRRDPRVNARRVTLFS
jgi:hypothetical protein